jgi:DNA-directed RNA polymerase subunit F
MPDPVPLANVRALLTDVDQTAKFIQELRTLPYVDAAMAIKLADVLPQFPEEVRLLFSKERVLLDEAQLTRLLELIAQYR